VDHFVYRADTKVRSRSEVPDHKVSEDPCDEEDKEHLDSILKSQPESVSEFWKQKYEEDAGKYWDLFYKRNDDKFFKDRHYLRFVIGLEIKAKINLYESQIQRYC